MSEVHRGGTDVGIDRGIFGGRPDAPDMGGATLPIIHKAVVYLTRTDPATGSPHLVVFDHVDTPEAGTQVPAGTVEAGEDVADAALREAFEETGLAGIRLVAALGTEDVDLRPYGVEAIARRHFFHATIDGAADVVAVANVDRDVDVDIMASGSHAVPDRWHHVESDRSDGGPPVTFALRWAPLASPPAIAAELGARLWMVQAALIPNIDD
ncbi:MAG: NUDIX domain-containing protein [Ardenticatenales bacterium]